MGETKYGSRNATVNAYSHYKNTGKWLSPRSKGGHTNPFFGLLASAEMNSFLSDAMPSPVDLFGGQAFQGLLNHFMWFANNSAANYHLSDIIESMVKPEPAGFWNQLKYHVVNFFDGGMANPRITGEIYNNKVDGYVKWMVFAANWTGYDENDWKESSRNVIESLNERIFENEERWQLRLNSTNSQQFRVVLEFWDYDTYYYYRDMILGTK